MLIKTKMSLAVLPIGIVFKKTRLTSCQSIFRSKRETSVFINVRLSNETVAGGQATNNVRFVHLSHSIRKMRRDARGTGSRKLHCGVVVVPTRSFGPGALLHSRLTPLRRGAWLFPDAAHTGTTAGAGRMMKRPSHCLIRRRCPFGTCMALICPSGKVRQIRRTASQFRDSKPRQLTKKARLSLGIPNYGARFCAM